MIRRQSSTGPRTLKGGCALALVLAATLAATPVAHAGRPFKLASGTGVVDPDVAVDGGGTAHVVWQPRAGVRYCAVPPAATRCDPASVRTLTQLELDDDPRVLVTAGGIVLVYAKTDAAPQFDDGGFIWTSNDGFASMNRLRKASSSGEPPADVDGTDVSLGPGQGLSLSEDGGDYERIPFGGLGTPNSASFGDEPQNTLAADFSRGGDQVAATEAVASVVRWGPPRRGTSFETFVEYNTYSGSGDPHSNASWSRPTRFPGNGAVVAGGPKGIVIAYRGNRGFPLLARKLDPSTLAPGGARTLGRRTDLGNDLWANPATGAFRALFESSGALRLARSADGNRWTRSILIVSDRALRATRASSGRSVAAGPNGRGLAVWSGRRGVFGARLTAVRRR